MYQRLYEGRAYLGKAEIEPVRREVAELRHRFAVGEPARVPRPPGAVEESGGVRGRLRAARPGSRGRASSGAPVRAATPEPLQLQLALPGQEGRRHAA
jgi:hypothetical protein